MRTGTHKDVRIKTALFEDLRQRHSVAETVYAVSDVRFNPELITHELLAQ